MSWHGPLSDWDVQYIPTRRGTCARRFLCQAGTSAEAVPHPTARGTDPSCEAEQAPCSCWGVFGKQASPSLSPFFWQASLSQLPQGSEGGRFHSHPQHPAAPSHALLGWIGRAAPLGATLGTWGHRSNVTAGTERAGEGRHRPAPPACTKRLGPAAKQDSKWKATTYRKLCEARLVSEDYRWAGNTSAGNRC